MPLSRLYARFLGGELQLLTLPSWGCSFKLSVANTVVGELDRATQSIGTSLESPPPSVTHLVGSWKP